MQNYDLAWYDCQWIENQQIAYRFYPMELNIDNDYDDVNVADIRDLDVFEDWSDEDWELYE